MSIQSNGKTASKVDLKNMRIVITTFTGKDVEPTLMTPEDVDISDIAHGLAMQARFNGQLQQFYPVSEHSICVMRMVPPELRLAALLHDAPEYLIGDLISPIKRHCDAYLEIENHVWRCIAKKFDLPVKMHSEVKRADDIRLQAEARWGFKHLPEQARPKWVDWSRPVDPNLKTINPMLAERNFLGTYHALMAEITADKIHKETSARQDYSVKLGD